MKISFIIPAYNEETCIDKCLDSVLKQTTGRPEEIEIIVVNNASTDKTKEIAASFPGVKVVEEPRKGLVNARRAGFLASKGEILANIDADTMLTFGWLDKVIKEFSKNKNLVALSGPHLFYDLSSAFRVLIYFFYGPVFIIYLINRFILRIGSIVQGGNFILKRSALEKIGGYDNENFDFYGEDTDIARRLFPVGDVKFTLSLPIFVSGRRIAVEGALKMWFRYGINYFWVIFLKKPFTNEYKDIRQ